MSLADRLLRGDKRAAARLISLIEDGAPKAVAVIREVYGRTGEAHAVAISGPPGAGKSTFLYHLVREFRSRGRTVGILAVDPTSPLTGGALLGDRVRMSKLTSDEGVFIRSMGTRGRLGGVSAATADAVTVLDAFGCDLVFVETAGVGQTDVEVAALTDTMVVLVMPESGDDVQALKAGIFEVADVFVVNKADLGGAEGVAADLRSMLELGEEGAWVPPVLLVSARRGEGIGEAANVVQAHWEFLETSGRREERRRKRAEREVLTALSEAVLARGLALREGEAYQRAVEEVHARKLSPQDAAARLLEEEASS